MSNAERWDHSGYNELMKEEKPNQNCSKTQNVKKPFIKYKEGNLNEKTMMSDYIEQPQNNRKNPNKKYPNYNNNTKFSETGNNDWNDRDKDQLGYKKDLKKKKSNNEFYGQNYENFNDGESMAQPNNTNLNPMSKSQITNIGGNSNLSLIINNSTQKFTDTLNSNNTNLANLANLASYNQNRKKNNSTNFNYNSQGQGFYNNKNMMGMNNNSNFNSMNNMNQMNNINNINFHGQPNYNNYNIPNNNIKYFPGQNISNPSQNTQNLQNSKNIDIIEADNHNQENERIILQQNNILNNDNMKKKNSKNLEINKEQQQHRKPQALKTKESMYDEKLNPNNLTTNDTTSYSEETHANSINSTPKRENLVNTQPLIVNTNPSVNASLNPNFNIHHTPTNSVSFSPKSDIYMNPASNQMIKGNVNYSPMRPEMYAHNNFPNSARSMQMNNNNLGINPNNLPNSMYMNQKLTPTNINPNMTPPSLNQNLNPLNNIPMSNMNIPALQNMQAMNPPFYGMMGINMGMMESNMAIPPNNFNNHFNNYAFNPNIINPHSQMKMNPQNMKPYNNQEMYNGKLNQEENYANKNNFKKNIQNSTPVMSNMPQSPYNKNNMALNSPSNYNYMMNKNKQMNMQHNNMNNMNNNMMSGFNQIPNFQGGNKNFKKNFNNQNNMMNNNMNMNNPYKMKFVKSDKSIISNMNQNSFSKNQNQDMGMNNGKIWRNNMNVGTNLNKNMNPMMRNGDNFNPNNAKPNSRNNFIIREEDRQKKQLGNEENGEDTYFSSDNSEITDSCHASKTNEMFNDDSSTLILNVKLFGREEAICIGKSEDYYKVAKEFVLNNNLRENLIKPIHIKIKQALHSIQSIFDNHSTFTFPDNFSIRDIENYCHFSKNLTEISPNDVDLLSLSCLTDLRETDCGDLSNNSFLNENFEKLSISR